MILEERLEIIYKEILKNDKVSNNYLLNLLDISEATLRRDLNILEKIGKIRRVHGGAVLTDIKHKEESYDKNLVSNIEAKREIAKKASQYLKDSKFIFIDSGTTTNFLIDYIDNKDVLVVTNGIMHLEKLIKKDINTIFIGGNVKSKTYAAIGEIAILNLQNFNFDVAFIGANGIDKIQGITTHDSREAYIKSLAIRQAKRSFILADKSKVGKVYFSKICDYNKIKIISE